MYLENSEQKSDRARAEEKILDFWKSRDIFNKTLEKRSLKGEFVFYDGPPFATGLPHYGHILPGTIKDAILRYKTMKGYHVPRRWGWDCHGLPIENLIEKEMGLKTKKDIEAFGIEKFNQAAQESVLRFADDWKKIIPRTGRWAQMENDYRTMDPHYTESVWWVFKTLYEKGLIYEGFKAMHLCPRCETTLSNFEVSQGYLDIQDFAITVKFPLADESNTSLLAWTTTPWTLPGNMALAVNDKITYGKFQISDSKSPEAKEYYIIAKERAKEVFGDRQWELVEELAGKDLVGKKYEPPFNYYKNTEIKNKENSWKIYSAQFVSLEEGTGIVHIAPAFGEDDLLLAHEKQIPVIHHVDKDGTFKKEVRDFAGFPVKPKGEHQKTDIEIIKNLAHEGLLFAKEKITHSYPHCWRCETPLLNYAARSWFVKVSSIKEKIIAQNKKIHWTPHDLRLGRFGKWLENARDWAISRSRYWGAPIPVWNCSKCEKQEIVGSLDELGKKSGCAENSYFIMRHGEAENNVKNILNADVSKKFRLTEKGEKDVLRGVKFLKNYRIDLIFSSPVLRTKETASLVATRLGIKKENIIIDERLREIGFGTYEGMDIDSYRALFTSRDEKFIKAPPEGETLSQVRFRAASFIYDIDKKYSHKNILIVSHDDLLWMLFSAARGANLVESMNSIRGMSDFLKTGQVKKMLFSPLPHNKLFELDLHRPYIDKVRFSCPCGGRMRRVPQVFDCWFESGSMPYGQFHYPLGSARGELFGSENGQSFEKIFHPSKKIGFPADFIAEGIDQTRGWAYSLLVLGVALFGVSPYKNVIVSGLVLSEDGLKMSKRLKNYPDPSYIINRYGADPLRLYLLCSPASRAEDLNFSEKGVQEVQNKIVNRFKNVGVFYSLHVGRNLQPKIRNLQSRQHILDRWITIRLRETVNQINYALEEYNVERAVRPIGLFIDDLSTWYIRRSRERFKKENTDDREDALKTSQYVLQTFSRVIAPFAPFIAEEVYQKTKGKNNEESVHLASWPEGESRIPVWPNLLALIHRIFGTHSDLEVLREMQIVREIVSLALEARDKAGIKVRQPIALLKIKSQSASWRTKIKNNEELLQLIKDEVNVKNIIFDADIENEIEIDMNITPELKKEGQLRELIRFIQDLRKEKGLIHEQKAILTVSANESGKQIIQEFAEEIKKTTSLEDIQLKDMVYGKDIFVDDMKFTLDINLKS